jgi:hypothetical protein
MQSRSQFLRRDHTLPKLEIYQHEGACQAISVAENMAL